MKIGIGNDHSALELKAEIIEFLRKRAMRSWTMEQIHRKAVITRFMGKSLHMQL